MTDDLLSREKEFRRINRELDAKTTELLKEVDLVVQNSNNNSHLATNKLFSPGFKKFHRLPATYDDFSTELSLENGVLNDYYKNNHQISKCRDTLTDQDKCSLRHENPSLDDDIFQDNNNIKSNEAIIKFLKAKIKVLMNDLDSAKDELKKKDNCVKDLQIDNKKINESKDKLNNKIINLKCTINKLENNIGNQQTELQTRFNENNSLKKDIESVKKELKNVNQQMNSLDLRLNRSLEDNEKLRNVIKSSKIEERCFKDKIRKLEDSERNIVKNNDRQFSEILHAFKKQCLLIDNLKKQKAYLEASKQIQLTRDDFLKILKTEI